VDVWAAMAGVAELFDGSGWVCYGHIPDDVEPPALVVSMGAEFTYSRDFRGGMVAAVEMIALVATVEAEDAQRRVAAALSTTGDGPVPAVVPILRAGQSNKPLWNDLQVRSASGPQPFLVGGERRLLGVVFNLTIT